VKTTLEGPKQSKDLRLSRPSALHSFPTSTNQPYEKDASQLADGCSSRPLVQSRCWDIMLLPRRLSSHRLRLRSLREFR
jgi:hypothetical protein